MNCIQVWTSNVKPPNTSVCCPRRASSRSRDPSSGSPEGDTNCWWPGATSGKNSPERPQPPTEGPTRRSPISAGKSCTKMNDRCAMFTAWGGVLWHEEAEEVEVDRSRNHYELERWIKPGNVLALMYVGGCSGSARELAGPLAAAPQRLEAHAPRADEEHIEPEIFPVALLPGPREPSKEEIEKLILSFHFIQLDYAFAGTQSGTAAFRLHGWNRHEHRSSLGINCIDQSQGGSIHCLFVSLSWLSELGYSKIIIQSDVEPASEVVIAHGTVSRYHDRKPPCEIIQQQSQRYSHQSNGGAERTVQTIRNQIKAYKIQIEQNAGTTLQVDSHLLALSPRHAARQ